MKIWLHFTLNDKIYNFYFFPLALAKKNPGFITDFLPTNHRFSKRNQLDALLQYACIWFLKFIYKKKKIQKNIPLQDLEFRPENLNPRILILDAA